jgi:hypothetical protein
MEITSTEDYVQRVASAQLVEVRDASHVAWLLACRDPDTEPIKNQSKTRV